MINIKKIWVNILFTFQCLITLWVTYQLIVYTFNLSVCTKLISNDPCFTYGDYKEYRISNEEHSKYILTFYNYADTSSFGIEDIEEENYDSIPIIYCKSKPHLFVLCGNSEIKDWKPHHFFLKFIWMNDQRQGLPTFIDWISFFFFVLIFLSVSVGSFFCFKKAFLVVIKKQNIDEKAIEKKNEQKFKFNLKIGLIIFAVYIIASIIFFSIVFKDTKDYKKAYRVVKRTLDNDLKGKTDLDSLRFLLQNDQIEIQNLAAEYLWFINSIESKKILKKHLNDSNSTIKFYAIKSLDDDKDTLVLQNMFNKEKDKYIKRNVARKLSEFKSNYAKQYLKSLLNSKNDFEKELAFESLCYLEDTTIIDSIDSFIKNESYNIREIIAEKINYLKMNQEMMKSYLNKLSNDTCLTVKLFALKSKIDAGFENEIDTNLISEILNTRNTSNYWARFAVVDILIKQNNSFSRRKLLEVANSKMDDIRYYTRKKVGIKTFEKELNSLENKEIPAEEEKK